ncbi:MAG: HD domain-containing protein [Candidatus Symbiothrix sp.]|jgi:uncharacterized protein|nr:HD domain-containing protein [Candidatus Symbiothrix sp.]
MNNDLKNYIENDILPEYNAFDRAHDTAHIQQVINDSLLLAQNFDVDIDMVYTIAAYHDIGIGQNREFHHIISGKILKADKNLKRWFTAQQIDTMQKAVEDHRASNDYEPRDIYGKIIAEADRDISLKTILRRTLQYGLTKYSCVDFEFHFNRAYSHIKDKYGENGYLKLYLHSEKNERGLLEIRAALHNKKLLRKMFEEMFLQELANKPVII